MNEGILRKEDIIKVVYVEEGKPARVIEMKNTLEEMQKKVGGLIQPCYYFDDPVAIVCNDEGWLLSMPPNRAVYSEHTGEILSVIPGSFFICYTPPESEHFHSLPPQLLEKYQKMFKHPEMFIKTNEGIAAIRLEPEKKKRDRREDRR